MGSRNSTYRHRSTPYDSPAAALVDPQQTSDQDDILARMLVGRSAAIQQVVKQVRQVAQYASTSVLLQGESGTGKDVVARALHELSSRAGQPFIPINCAAIPETLLETELFGVEAGAFTDAKSSRDGYLLRADRGTLFLDEIGAMPLVLQAKLLRFLETFSFQRVGGTREIHVNLRIVSATNVNLQAAVARRTFRNDLFYRLNVMPIFLPPLRERLEDVEPLVRHFLQIQSATSAQPLDISPEALELLQHYTWPGNVRELRSVMESGQVLCDDYVIRPKDLPIAVRQAALSPEQRLHEVFTQLHLPSQGIDLPQFLRGIERTFIKEALALCNGNQVHAASLLHLSRDQLRYRLATLAPFVSDEETTDN